MGKDLLARKREFEDVPFFFLGILHLLGRIVICFDEFNRRLEKKKKDMFRSIKGGKSNRHPVVNDVRIYTIISL